MDFRIDVANVLEVEPNPINCMRLNETGTKLTLFRGGKTPQIELWDVRDYPLLEKTFTELEYVEDKPSVESLVWIKSRLFSCGLHGFVLEHCMSSTKVKEKYAATSGPVWCIEKSPDGQLIAAGTEDGFINLFEVVDDGLRYLKVLDRQEGRVLCLDWSKCGKYIATGSVDSIRLWDVQKGHALQRLITGRSKKRETVVWSILLLDDFTIVSGDSRGIVSFWNGKIGVLKFKIISHKADVLTMKLSEDGNSIYTAGVEPSVVLISRLGKGERWMKSHVRNMHLNDILCLETCGNRLFSAGFDSDLVVSSFPPKIVTKYPPLQFSMPIQLCHSQPAILTVPTANKIVINQLPWEKFEFTPVLKLEPPQGEFIHSFCIQPDASLFAYTTPKRLRFYSFSVDVKNDKLIPSLRKLTLDCSDSEDLMSESWKLCSLVENSALMISSTGSLVVFITFCKDEEKVVLSSPCELALPELQSGIDSITSNRKGNIACVLCSSNSIVLLSISLSSVSYLATVPKYSSRCSVTKLHPTLPYLLIAYADRHVRIFNYDTCKLVLDVDVRKASNTHFQPIHGGCWSESGSMGLLYDIENLYLISMQEIEKGPKKKRKGVSGSIAEEEYTFSVRYPTVSYKHIAYADFLSENKILALEVTPKSLLEKLPPKFAQRRFGVS